MGMRYTICQQATDRFRPSELTKHHPRCPFTDNRLIVVVYIKWECNRADEFKEKIAEPNCFLGYIGKSNVLSFYS